MSNLYKTLKYKNKSLIVKQNNFQYGGEIRIRSRRELIQFLIDNGSLSIPQATKLDTQLKIIDEQLITRT